VKTTGKARRQEAVRSCAVKKEPEKMVEEASEILPEEIPEGAAEPLPEQAAAPEQAAGEQVPEQTAHGVAEGLGRP